MGKLRLQGIQPLAFTELYTSGAAAMGEIG